MTSLANFNEGQEIIFQDLNKIGTRVERFILDKVIYELMGRRTDGFYQDGLKVSRVSTTQIQVAAGLGFHTEIADSADPDLKPLLLDATLPLTVSTPDSTNDRIDIVSVKSVKLDSETEARKFKDEFTGTISTQSLVISKEWGVIVTVTQGVASGSPVVPSTPAGELIISQILVEAINGIVADVNVTDLRLNLPVSSFVEYDAVIGNISTIGVTHLTLKSALDDDAVTAGSKILVIKSETLNITPEITKEDITIEFKGASTLIKGTATVGLLISANGAKIKNGRFSGFSTGGDKAISIAPTFKYCMIRDIRFASCDTEIDDLGSLNDYSGLITE